MLSFDEDADLLEQILDASDTSILPPLPEKTQREPPPLPEDKFVDMNQRPPQALPQQRFSVSEYIQPKDDPRTDYMLVDYETCDKAGMAGGSLVEMPHYATNKDSGISAPAGKTLFGGSFSRLFSLLDCFGR